MWIPRRKYALEKNTIICDLYKSGKSVSEICCMMNIKTRGQIYKHLWASNVERRPYVKVLTSAENMIQ